ncbi:MAG TPA: GIY-YIG nuclease family protein, partial [Candidatus Acidoferrum sp.]|nr:GIY-YIG nuclease family protein [Candidatus Acidoferrum sp.]
RTRGSGVRISPGAPLFMFFIYVLRNQSTGRLYTGHTADLTQRLGQHNHGISKSTKNRGTWDLVYQEEFATRSEAMRRERSLKSGQGRAELKQILSKLNPRSSAG